MERAVHGQGSHLKRGKLKPASDVARIFAGQLVQLLGPPQNVPVRAISNA